MAERAQILPGTLDLLILQAVSLGRLYGYGILLRIEREEEGWNRLGAAIPAALKTRPEEICGS
jgi:DNA-binding PadR family transcriptional regulator